MVTGDRRSPNQTASEGSVVGHLGCSWVARVHIVGGQSPVCVPASVVALCGGQMGGTRIPQWTKPTLLLLLTLLLRTRNIGQAEQA